MKIGDSKVSKNGKWTKSRTGVGSWSWQRNYAHLGDTQEIQHGSNTYDFSEWDKYFNGTDYEGLYNATKEKYNIEIPQTLLGDLTGKNQEMLYNHQMSLQTDLQALKEKMYNEQYQSPISEVQRNNQAGINSDLNGLSGATSPEMQGAGSPTATVNNDLDTVGNIAGVIFQTLNIAKSLSMQNLQIDSMRIDNAKKAFDFGRNAGLNMLYPQGSENADKNANIIEGFATLAGIKKRNIAKQVTHGMLSATYGNNLDSGYYKRGRGVAEDRENQFVITSGVNYSPEDEVYAIFTNALANLRYEANKASLESSKASSNESKNKSLFLTNLNETMRVAISKLAEASENGNHFASAALLALQVLMSSSPSFSRSTSPKGTTTNIGF